MLTLNPFLRRCGVKHLVMVMCSRSVWMSYSPKTAFTAMRSGYGLPSRPCRPHQQGALHRNCVRSSTEQSDPTIPSCSGLSWSHIPLACPAPCPSHVSRLSTRLILSSIVELIFLYEFLSGCSFKEKRHSFHALTTYIRSCVPRIKNLARLS